MLGHAGFQGEFELGVQDYEPGMSGNMCKSIHSGKYNILNLLLYVVKVYFALDLEVCLYMISL